MTHPYADLPPRAFWQTGVAETDRDHFPGLYEPRLAITTATRVATAGSCFAQHIGRRLTQAGCTVLDAEPPPRAMPATVAQAFGYSLFSGRYGNIYTARQLRQLLTDIIDGHVDARFVWEKRAGFVDAFRPTVEPEGLGSVDEVLLHRAYHLERTSMMLRQTDVFIFTLGLTEAWMDAATGRVFPVCPGVAAGQFDPTQHVFHKFRHAEVLDDLTAIHAMLQRFRPGMQMLLTVSPVPLTATMSGHHVLTATAASKATLRAAADEFVSATQGTDYFPSLEIVTSPACGGPWFAPNMREVSSGGVNKVMSIFLAAHGLSAAPSAQTPDIEVDDPQDDVICDDLLLQAFSR